MTDIGIFSILNGLITVLAAISAFGVYFWQKRDEKKKASRIILMEIRHAESKLNEIRDNGIIAEHSVLLPTNSWSKYSNLFVKDLDADELDLVNKFFGRCFLADDEIRRITSYLPLAMEEKSRYLQQKLIDLACQYSTPKGHNKKEYEKHKEKILDTVHKENYWFLPETPKKKIVDYLKNIELVTNTTAGQKLKRIAEI